MSVTATYSEKHDRRHAGRNLRYYGLAAKLVRVVLQPREQAHYPMAHPIPLTRKS